MNVDKDLIRELARLLEETGLSEIEVREEGRSLRVARQLALAVGAPAPAPPANRTASTVNDDLAGHPGAVTSPMVGTVYLAPSPEAEPFVKAGDTVSAGDTLLIVEAMKTMNPIPAPRDGRVSRILVSDGSPVEFGDVLVLLD